AIITWAAALLWLVFVANLTVSYLTPHLVGATRQTIGLIAGETTGRQLFRTYSGDLSPIWQQVVGYASTVLILLGLPFGLVQIWRRHRANAAAVALAIGALAYPASLPFRLTSAGAEAASRATEFLFLGIAFVLGAALVEV